MLLRWEDRHVDVGDFEELEGRLDEIRAQHSDPLFVSLTGSSGTLSVGVGHPRGGLLLFLPADGSPSPLHSLGDADAEPDELRFRSGATTVGFFARCLISDDVLREAVRSFLDQDTLSPCVTWEPEPVGESAGHRA
jgi:hypothetical protein